MDNVHTNNIQVCDWGKTGFASQWTSHPNISILHSLMTTDLNVMFKKEMIKTNHNIYCYNQPLMHITPITPISISWCRYSTYPLTESARRGFVPTPRLTEP